MSNEVRDLVAETDIRVTVGHWEVMAGGSGENSRRQEWWKLTRYGDRGGAPYTDSHVAPRKSRADGL